MRSFSTLRPLLNKGPGFLSTLKEASKPPLTKPEMITKPFGFDDRTTLKTTEISVFNMFSKEGKAQRQRQLDHDIAHSPFYESKSFENTKGKIFMPPISYFKQEKAKYFPNLEATSLLGKHTNLYSEFKDKVSLVRIFATLSGENCTKTYVGQYLNKEQYDEFQKQYPNAQLIDLFVPQSWVKGLFVSSGSLRRSVPKIRQDTFFLLPHGCLDVDSRRTLKCDNTCAGYLYVVDEEGKIRWATSGNATESEKEVLWKTVRGLEKELVNKNETC